MLLILIGIIVWLNHQALIDTFTVWRYTPSAQVAEITNKIPFTDNGKFTFFAARPSVLASDEFNSKCDRKEQNTAILGCYVGDTIYVFNVSDQRLEGIKEVTAAHEMLHAAYYRLSPGEKQRINELVAVEFEELKNNPTYMERMEFYARTEPGERDNELHSIIATEIANIGQELENYYSRYFTDRQAIVDVYQSYNSTFTSLAAAADQLSEQLDQLNKEIEFASKRYNEDVEQLNADIESFNQRARNGDFASQAQFNDERQSLVTRADQVSNSRQNINELIAEYNRLRDEYNDTVTQSNNLYKSIDSSLAPAPQV